MAAAAAAVDPALEAVFQSTCEAVAALQVSPLDEKRPEKDWHRWKRSVTDQLSTRPFFSLDLLFTGNIAAVPVANAAALASNDLAAFVAAAPTLQQRRQLALRAFLNNSLIEDGDARKLIKDCPFAGGVVAGVPQAFATLRTRYETTELPDDPNAEVVELLAPKWPSKLDPTDYQAMVSEKIRVATKLGLDASDATRAMWWPVISSPPPGHPMYAAAETAHTRTNGERATAAHRTRFIAVMLDELQRAHAAQTRRAADQRARRALIAEIQADRMEVDAQAVYRPRPPDKGSPMPSPAPGGGLVQHPCARGCKIIHAFGYKCDVEVECNTCGSESHIDEFCWIKNGLKVFNLRLPPAVAEKYEEWHRQFKENKYVKVPGGPPRVRLARKVRPQRAPAALASVSEDEEDYCMQYLGSSTDGALEPARWAQRCEVSAPLSFGDAPTRQQADSFGKFTFSSSSTDAREVEVLRPSLEETIAAQRAAVAARIAGEAEEADRLAAQAAAYHAGLARWAAERPGAQATVHPAATFDAAISMADVPVHGGVVRDPPRQLAPVPKSSPSSPSSPETSSRAHGAEMSERGSADQRASFGPSLETPRLHSVSLQQLPQLIAPPPPPLPPILGFFARFVSLRSVVTLMFSMWAFVLALWTTGALVVDRVRDWIVLTQYCVYVLVVTFAFAGLVHTAVQLLIPRPVGAFAPSALRPLSFVHVSTPPPVVYHALDASVLVDVFEVTNGRNEAGRCDVSVDTGADMLCLTSTVNTRVLEWNPNVVVRVANSQAIPIEALVETVVHFPVTGRKQLLRSGLVSSQFKKVLLSGPALAREGIETRTIRGPKYGGALEWADGALEPFDGPPYHIVVTFSAPSDLGAAVVQVAKVGDATVLLWHERIGHAGDSTLSKLHVSTDGTPFTSAVSLPHVCEHCMANKAIRRFLASHDITAMRVGQLTHIDVHGPYAEDIFFGARYDICFVDDFSNVRFIASIPDRVWATQQRAFLKYSAFINFFSGFTVNIAGCQFDNAPEYEGVESEEFCDDAAIQRLFSVRYRPAQHGKAESTWRIYYPRVRACLNKAMPPEKGRRFRALAMQHLVNYVGNRLPSKSAPSNVAPMTVLCGGKVQTLRWARVLFCRVWTFVPVETRGLKSTHHMDPVARPAIHCGVAHNHKGWLAYHEDDGTFEAFIDGKFEETVMPMQLPDAPPWPLPPPGPVPPNPNERGFFELPAGLPADSPAAAPDVPPPERVSTSTPPRPPARVESGRVPESPWQLPGSGDQTAQQPRRRGSRTSAAERFAAPGFVEPARLATEIDDELSSMDPEDVEDRLSWVTIGGIPVPYDLAFCDVDALAARNIEAKIKHFQLDDGWVALDVPRNYPEAMRHRRSPQLWQAMINEMHSQLDTKSHYLVPRPTDGTFVHTLGWVYDFKLKEGAVVDKARLVGHGHKSVLGTHFFDKTAQVARASSVRTICAYAAQYNLTLTAGDVPTAYLQSFLHNVVILSEQPPGFEVPGPNGEPAKDMVARWDRALYGWVPSCYEWGEEFYDWLISYGATACYSDVKVFVLVRDVLVAGKNVRALLIITLHVDDLLMAHSHVELREQFMRDNPYRIKDLGAVTSIIGADIHQDLHEGFVKVSLSTYIQSAVRRFDITDVGCDMPASDKLIAACRAPVGDREFEECTDIFLKMAGILNFIATFVRAELIYVAHFLTTYTHRCGHAHINLVRRALGYCLRTHDLCLTYRRSESFHAVGVFIPSSTTPDARLHAVVDSDFAVTRSRSGMVVMLGGAGVLWRVVMHRSPSISPAESEFYGLSTGVCETLHVRQLLEELGHVFTTATQIFCDSRAARFMATYGASSKGTRHIHRRWHFTKFHTDAGELYICEIKGAHNPVNCMTKLVVGVEFRTSRTYLLGRA